MNRIDQHVTVAPADIVFRVAADVERWPEILPHYRWVRFNEKRSFGRGVVEMAAWRELPGPFRWPTWWKSNMEADPDEPIIRYQHIDGITTGMDVAWLFLPANEGTVVRITHDWQGPSWPIISGFAANRVIGPHFVSFIAQRTLAGVCAEAERVAGLQAPDPRSPEPQPEKEAADA
jgi:uncharacterized membrane protein